MFLSGCYEIGLNESQIAKEPDTRAKVVAPVCGSYSVLCGKCSIRIEWTLSAIDKGAVFSVQRASDSGRKFVELQEIRAGSGILSFRYCDERCRPGRSYRYRVEYRSAAGTSLIIFETKEYTAPAVLTDLYQNYPNPFDTFTGLRFSIAETGKVFLSVYDVEGRLVRILVDLTLDAGSYGAAWGGRDDAGRPVATGVYFCSLRTGGRTISRKIILIR